jgi:hypothetical protein
MILYEQGDAFEQLKSIALFIYKRSWTVKNQIFKIDKQDTYMRSREYFIARCGLNLDREKHQKMMKQGLDILENGLNGIEVKALVSFYGEDSFKMGGKVVLDGVEFKCDAFENIDYKSMKGIYIYVITVGECATKSDNIVDRLYADIWGTSYIDVGREILKEKILEHISENDSRQIGRNIFLSDAFGPGFYGMDILEVQKFFQILDGEKIGVELKPSGLMVPLKSCVGFYLIVDDENKMPQPSCKDCIGSAEGCQYCKRNIDKFEKR